MKKQRVVYVYDSASAEQVNALLDEGYEFHGNNVPIGSSASVFLLNKYGDGEKPVNAESICAVVNCQANCTKEDVVKAVELLTVDEAPKKKKGRPKKVKEETPVVVEADTFSLTSDIPGTV